MDYDNQKALKIFCELRTELQKSDETAKLKQLNQIIAVLESSFFTKIVNIYKSLEAIKNQKNLEPDDIEVDVDNAMIRLENSPYNSINSKTNQDTAKASKSLKQLPLTPMEFENRLQYLCGNRELVHILINKDNVNQTLGFSIKCSNSLQANGIFIEEVSSEMLGERCGVKPYDQIIAVDGKPLDNPATNKDIAIQALKNNNMRIDLYLARDKFKHQLIPPPKDQTHIRNRSDIGFTQELDTEWTQYEIITLDSYNGSFGFGIMGGLTREVMVRNILAGGAADLDGRLQINDHIMYINNISVRNCSSNQVADILKNQTNEVRLIVARPFDQTSSSANNVKVQMVETSNLDSRLEMIVNQLYPENILNNSINSNKNLDLFTKTKQNLSAGDIDRKTENQHGVEDVSEFVQIDLTKPDKNLGITLIELSNNEDLDGIYVKDVVQGSIAENCNIKKFDRIIKVNDENIDIKKLKTSINDIINFYPMSFYIQRFISGPTRKKLFENERFNSSYGSSDMYINWTEMHDVNAPMFSESSDEDESSVSEAELTTQKQHQRKPLTLEEKLQLITKWKKRIDGNREIIIAEFSKFTEDGGLGISLEGTVDVEDNGLEVHPHHYIRSIIPNGPAGRNGFLKVKDELLEANDKRIYGLNHLDAVNVLKNLPLSVRIVVARAVAISNNSFVADDISMAADRLCQDLDDIMTRETGSGSLYSIKAKSQDNVDDWPLDENKLSNEASRSRSLDQVQGLAIWDRQITYIDLEKRFNGLGFSVLDYQDPVDPQQSVIVIRSLVPNGAASKDGRIFPGDRLMSVDDIDVSRASMAEAVDALKKTEPGIVRLGIVKALCLDSDSYAQNLPTINNEIDDELEDPITECDQVSLFDRISFANPSWSDSCSPNFELINDQFSNNSYLNHNFEGFDQQSIQEDLIDFSNTCPFKNDWMTFEDGFEAINDCNVYENVSSPRLVDEIENSEEYSVVPIPEALEHKIRVHKLSGQKLGIELSTEGLYSSNENGFMITAIDVGSPADKCNRLSIGDFITKIDDTSIRRATETEVKALLKQIISYSDDIRINFIPESDYQVFMQSKKIQSDYK